MLATGTATDTLGVLTSDSLTVAAGGATGIRTVQTSALATRVNFGNVVTGDIQGPNPVPDPYGGMGPVTVGITARMMRDVRTTGIRIFKHPDGTGNIVAYCWTAAGTVLASKTVAWVADGGGWQTILFDAPIELDENTSYHWGYYYPTADQNYTWTPWVFNGQDTCVYPFDMPGQATSGSGTISGGTFRNPGALAPVMTGTYRTAHNFHVDPLVEWDLSTPGYSAGETYYDQFPNGGSTFDFPISVFFSDPENLGGYRARGVNTLRAGDASDAYIAAIKASGMDWYPSLHGGDTSAIVAVAEDPELAARVRGYLITDEPDLNTPWNSPAVVRSWRNAARRLDSTRPLHINLSRFAAINQGFTWQPVGISAVNANLQWREYLSLADSASLDLYSLSGTDSFSYSSAPNRYGLWVYPLVIQRMREQLTDERIPLWSIIETTGAYPDSPTPNEVKRAVWASLIAGAKGIEYFDHRFAGPAVTQDFAAMLNDSAMTSAIGLLNAQIQSLAPALWAPEAGYITGYTTSGNLATAQGGLPEGDPIPLHYTTRVVGGTTYFFIQAIRSGSTGATISIPGFEGATLTVIGESRTRPVNSSGVFSDNFIGDYTYHLYSTTHTPAFSAPANTVAPVIGTDGSPETEETVTVSTGTWTGVPAPSFTYQWKRGGTPISGATASSYTLQVADEGASITCTVTGTNSEGSASATSAAITPTEATDTGPSISIFGTADPGVADTNLDFLGFFSSTPGWLCNRFNLPAGSVVTGARLYVNPSVSMTGFANPNLLEFGLWDNASTTPDAGAGRSLANYEANIDARKMFSGTVTPGAWHEVTFDTPFVTSGSAVWAGHLWGTAGEFGQLWTDNRSGVTASPADTDLTLAYGGTAIMQPSGGGGWSPGAFYVGMDLLVEGESYASMVDTLNPSAHWRLEDYTDASGNGHTLTVGAGTFTPVASLINDPADGAQHIDNTGTAYLTTPDTSDLRLTGAAAFSVEAWVETGTGVDAMTLIAKAGDFQLQIFNPGGTLKFRFKPLGNTWYADCDGTTTVVPGTLYHVVGTWELSTKLIKIYVNGVLETTVDASSFGYSATTSGWGPLHLGYNSSAGGAIGFTGGSLDEVAVYRSLLTPAQVAAHYAAGTA